jgi:hypothetical protein
MARVFMRAGRGGYWVDEDTGEKFINENDPARLGQQPPAVVPGSPAPPLPPPIEVSTPPQPPAALTQRTPPGALSTGTPAPQADPAAQPGALSAADELRTWNDKQNQQVFDTKMQGGENDARKQAIYSGLIGMGAGLLNYDARKGYGAALGQGFENFNKAYDTELVANRPKVTPIANGAFSQIVWPDGRIEVISNTEAQKYIQQNKQMEADILAGRDYRRGSVDSIRNDMKQNKETQQKLMEQVNANEPQLQKLESALKVVETMKPGENLLNLPGVNQVAQAFNIGGADTLSKLKQLTEVKVDETLLNTARTKGAISNAEMELFQKPIPSDYANPEVWKPWLQNRITVLRKYNDFIKGQAAGLKTSMSEGDIRREVTGGGPSNTGAGNVSQSVVETYGVPYDPGMIYRVGPNGELQSRKK